LKKPVRSAAKKVIAKVVAKKKTALKTSVKKVVTAKARTVAKKPAAKKLATKKPAAKKIAVAKPKLSARKNTAPKKPLAKKTLAKKVQAPQKAITKTAERKAKRAAKAIAKPAVTIVAAPAPIWSPLVQAVLHQLDDAKAEQIVTVDLTGKSSVADTMIVASGRSNRHVNAVADQVVEALEKNGQRNIKIEGVPQCDWVLVDAGDIIVHIFRPEVRSFYNIEKLWTSNVPE
jgi:ribosome-associated protein